MFRVNKHMVSSSVLPSSRVTEHNNPNYPGIADWAANTELSHLFGAQLRSIDSMVEAGEIPSPDFVSMDIQGFELAAMRGASKCLDQSVLGIVTESEFAEIYEGQGMFYDQLILMEEKAFRLVDFETRQDWFIGPPLGKGFLTVAESFFLKHVIDVKEEEGMELRPLKGAVPIGSISAESLLKLALIAFVYNRFSYFHYIFRYIKSSHEAFFAEIAGGDFADYVKVFDRISANWGVEKGTSEYFARNIHKLLSGLENRPIRKKGGELLLLLLQVYREVSSLVRLIFTPR